jgi:small subunit ribosomal protein S4
MINGPMYKICRRLGAGVYDKCQTAKFAQSEANAKPRGKRGKALSDYAQQFLEKQRVRFSYGITERQFGNYITKAQNKHSKDTANELFCMLETRLDNIIYRSGLANSRRLARQMAAHGHFTVNGVKTTIPSQDIKATDTIGVREGSKDSKLFTNVAEKMKTHRAPEWVSLNQSTLEITLKGRPKNTDGFLNLNSVLEFYSR